MDFSIIFQLRTKKFWWMDVIFYFVISLLIATVFCYLIFLVKNNFQREDIKKEIAALKTVGTEQQKGFEKEVINYRNKINDYSGLLANHEFASNTFAFMQAQTMPNIWFTQFSLDEKNRAIKLSGEADNIDAFSRQVAVFEKNEYVKSVGALNSALGDSSRVQFSMNLVLDQNIFSYISKTVLAIASAEQPLPKEEPVLTAGATGQTPSNEKLITSFHLLLTPEVIGTIDQTNYIIKIDVPYGTDVKNLTTSMVISPLATVLPASNTVGDFTNFIVYTITAQDNSTQEYRVVVNVLPKNAGKSKPSLSNVLIIILSVIFVVAAVAVIIFFAWKKFKQKKEHAN